MTLIVVAGSAVAAVAAFFGLTWYFRQTDPRLSPVPVVVAAFIFGIGLFVSTTLVIVPFGEVGIVTFNGALTNKLMEPGLNFKWPFINSVYYVNTQMRALRIQNDQVFTKDLQNATNNYVINFS